MIHNCKCGGRMVPVDPSRGEFSEKYGRVLYYQTRIEPGYASFRCDKCGKRAKQKLRVSKKQ